MLKRSIIFALALLGGVLVFVGKCQADARLDPKPGDYFDNGTLRIVLGSEPCTVKEALDALKPEARPFYRQAELVFEGRSLKGCWRYLPGHDAVFILDEDGD